MRRVEDVGDHGGERGGEPLRDPEPLGQAQVVRVDTLTHQYVRAAANTRLQIGQLVIPVPVRRDGAYDVVDADLRQRDCGRGDNRPGLVGDRPANRGLIALPRKQAAQDDPCKNSQVKRSAHRHHPLWLDPKPPGIQSQPVQRRW